MEIYRVLHYEITKKVTKLNYEMTNPKERFAVWFDTIGLFSLNVMDIFLTRFENQQLALGTILENLEFLYEMISFYYKKTLPHDLQALLTYEETMNSYLDQNIKYIDHGWDSSIPDLGDDL